MTRNYSDITITKDMQSKQMNHVYMHIFYNIDISF